MATLYECDHCKEQKPCVKTRIIDRVYDFCGDCRGTLLKSLELRGEPIVDAKPKDLKVWFDRYDSGTFGGLQPNGPMVDYPPRNPNTILLTKHSDNSQ